MAVALLFLTMPGRRRSRLFKAVAAQSVLNGSLPSPRLTLLLFAALSRCETCRHNAFAQRRGSKHCRRCETRCHSTPSRCFAFLNEAEPMHCHAWPLPFFAAPNTAIAALCIASSLFSLHRRRFSLPHLSTPSQHLTELILAFANHCPSQRRHAYAQRSLLCRRFCFFIW